jgi:hypothetical protein
MKTQMDSIKCSLQPDPLPPVSGEIPAQLQAMIDRSEIANRSVFVQAKSLYTKLLFQRDEFARKLGVLAERDRETLELIADTFKREDIENRDQRELEELEMYEGGLRAILSEVQHEEVDRVLEALPRLGTRLREALIGQKRVEDEALAGMFPEGPEQIVADLDAAIAEKWSSIGGINEQIAAAEAELFQLEEELHSTQSVASREQTEIATSKAVDVQTGNYLRMVMCLKCKEAQRDVILRTCGHALCRKCTGGKDCKAKLCPICHRAFTNADVRPFLLNK